MKYLNLLRRFPGSSVALLLLLLLLAGCVGEGELGADTKLENYTFVKTELGNLRFELMPAGSSAIVHPSLNFRLHLGDEIAFKWDQFYGFWQREGAMCTFSQGTGSTEECRVCQDCNPTAGRGDIPCRLVHFRGDDVSFMVNEYKNFVVTPDNRKAVIVGSSQDWLCPLGVKHAPESDATYQIPSEKGVHGETKVFVYSGSPRSVQYQLSPVQLDGKTYWTWRVGGDLKWIENYSPTLKVTNVRIFEAACGLDMASNECTVPQDAPLVKPSRILFLTDLASSLDQLTASAFRCYSEERQNEITKSFIDLGKCITTYQGTKPEPRFLTPTYLHESVNDKVTWLVEFNTDEGGIDASMITNLIIQFDIEGV